MSGTVVKIGGSTVNSTGLMEELGEAVALLRESSIEVSVVHGGGKDIALELNRLNKEFTFIEGQRVTDSETMGAVQRVLSGDVNKRLTNSFLKMGVNAVGVSGVDNNLFSAEKLISTAGDLGFVGKIVEVEPTLIKILQDNSIVPIVSPVSRSKEGEFYNINADSAAAELAVALNSDDLIYISDVPGVLIDGAVAPVIKIDSIEQLISDGIIYGGMIPKLRSAADCVRRGVKRVHICGWSDAQTLQKELSESGSTGTTIKE